MDELGSPPNTAQLAARRAKQKAGILDLGGEGARAGSQAREKTGEPVFQPFEPGQNSTGSGFGRIAGGKPPAGAR